MPISLIIAILINIVLKILKKENNFLFIITVYSVAMFLLVYPISDNIHLLIAIMPCYIVPIYTIGILIKKLNKINFRYVFEFFEIASFIWIVLFTGYTEIK